VSRFPAAFPLPALASWSSCSRRGIGRSLRSAYQCARRGTGPRRGFRVSHARAAIGVGALSTPGTAVLILTGVAHRPALAASQRRVPALRRNVASMRSSALRSINQGFTRVHPSDLPLACGSRMQRQRLGLYPRASHPALAGDARRGGDRSSSTDLKQRSMSSTEPPIQRCSLDACDLASHATLQKRRAGTVRHLRSFRGGRDASGGGDGSSGGRAVVGALAGTGSRHSEQGVSSRWSRRCLAPLRGARSARRA
jgi:hypothetical protein